MFEEIFNRYEWAAVRQSIYGKTAADVERALVRANRDLETGSRKSDLGR
jgi:hypothetical protein